MFPSIKIYLFVCFYFSYRSSKRKPFKQTLQKHQVLFFLLSINHYFRLQITPQGSFNYQLHVRAKLALSQTIAVHVFRGYITYVCNKTLMVYH